MSSVNYNLNNRGVRLVDSQDAWVRRKNGSLQLNYKKYQFIGKIEMSMPNMVISASDKNKPKYRGDVCNLNSIAKKQIIDHFYEENGKRNKKTVAYFVIEKKGNKK